MAPIGRAASGQRTTPATWVGVLLTIAVIGLLDMPATTVPADPYYWRQEAYSLLKTGSLAVDPAAAQGGATPYVRNPRNGKWYSKYGPMNAIMFLVPVAAGEAFAPRPTPLDDTNLLVLNLWNIALGLVLAAVLLAMAQRYTQRTITQVLFVFGCLYTTYLWYYLRAQTGEIYQAVFYTGAFLLLTRFLHSLGRGDDARPDLPALGWTWVLLGMLLLTRIIFIILLPVAAGCIAAELARLGRTRAMLMLRRIWPWVVAPPVILLLLLGAVNYIKFGSPLLTGYHQSQPELHYPVGPLWDGVWGLLFLPRFSVFLYFPLIAMGLLALRESLRRYRIDTAVACSMFIIFLLALGKVPTWAGEWTYGPRYILFALPPLAIPFILLIDRLIDSWRRPRTLALIGVISFCLAYSAYLQMLVNSVDFYTYYQVRLPLEQHWSDSTAGYFRDHHVGSIIRDLLRHRDDPEHFAWFREFAERAPAGQVDAYRRHLKRLLNARNRYWWQD